MANTSDDSVPSVFSISYGDDEPGVTLSYATRCSSEFQITGARGISLLVASGDSGAGCSSSGFVPTFPASNPWVTGVGGTTGGTAGKVPTGEGVASLSGGGFSNYFGRPAYQDAAVTAYFSHPMPNGKLFNKTGAGFPDIAAQALQFDVCTDGFFFPIDGTSAACPTASGIFAMLNQVRLNSGKPKLGFLNPLIYQSASCFNDVTSGENNYCGGSGGFPATTGWDATTGWGTPNFHLLNAAIRAFEN